MAAVKPDKIREETYDMIRNAIEKLRGITPIGRAKEGLVYENHLDGEHIVIKVIRKKNDYLDSELKPILNYQEQIEEYNKKKEVKE
jgi:hypothetical protein